MIVLPTSVYGDESWIIYQHHLRLLERFHQYGIRANLKMY